ncbi:MraY family glycosyltransferase [[Eubacterium] cellulosolvens]
MNPLTLVILFILNFIITYALVPRIAQVMRNRGITGTDIHKVHRPEISEMCGLALWPSIIFSLIMLSFLDQVNIHLYLAFLFAILVAGLIGFKDDLTPLNPRVKPALTVFAGLPILFLNAYSPTPVLPFIGSTRLTIVYPFLVLIGLAVTSNSVNMMDVFNGVMPGTCSIITFFSFLTLIYLKRYSEATLPLIVLGGLIAFYIFNRYPAKVFAGDSGSLFVGAALGSIAIIGRVEIIMIIALMPHIMNAYYGLSSIGRFYERREVKDRPIEIFPDGKLAATGFRHAPITLTRLILAQGPLHEKEIIKFMMIFTALSCALALATLLFIPGMIR